MNIIVDPAANLPYPKASQDAHLKFHCKILKDDLQSIKDCNTDVGDKKQYVKTVYSLLLDKLFDVFREGNKEMLNFLYEQYGISLWSDKNIHTIVHFKIDDVKLII